MLCPVIVAVLLLAVIEGPRGALELFKGLLRWKVGAQWYILAILLPVIIEILTLIAFVAISGKLPEGYTFSRLSWIVTFDILISSVALAIALGYMIPLLMKTYNWMVTAAITAIFLIVYRGTSLINDPNAIVMCIGLFALAFLLVWIYDSTMHSMLLLAIFLFMYTFMSNLFTYRIASYSGTSLPIYLNKVIFIVSIVTVILLYRRLYLD